MVDRDGTRISPGDAVIYRPHGAPVEAGRGARVVAERPGNRYLIQTDVVFDPEPPVEVDGSDLTFVGEIVHQSGAEWLEEEV
ncbi:MAG TPA: hypothetical protein VE990_01770 [Acidimicrobiales bacterium]|nr:hypothetical protein [Acidimicrobiales bacterium]